MAAAVTVLSFSGRSIEGLTMDVRAFEGQPWRLVTSALPHGDVFHLVFNLVWLWLLGTLVEESFGHLRTLALFVLLAAGSMAAEYALFGGGIGLSGVGYGLFGMLFVLSRRDPRFADAMDTRTAQLFAGWFVLCIVTTVTNVWRVANVAHGAGAVLGALMGAAAARPLAPARRIGAVVGFALALAASVAGATVLRPRVNLSRDGGDDSARLGYEALEAGRNDEAIAHYRRATRIAPGRAASWYNLGVALGRAGETGGAVESFDRAAALEPSDESYRGATASARRRLAWEAQRRGDDAEAARLYEEALQKGGEDAIALFNLGVAYGALGRDADAQRAMRRARELDPDLDAEPARSGEPGGPDAAGSP